jgi:hypothetical protein
LPPMSGLLRLRLFRFVSPSVTPCATDTSVREPGISGPAPWLYRAQSHTKGRQGKVNHDQWHPAEPAQSKPIQHRITVKIIGHKQAWYVDGEFVCYQSRWSMLEQYNDIRSVYPGAKLY